MILMAANRSVAADSSRVLMRVVQCAQPHACISILVTCNRHNQVIAASLFQDVLLREPRCLILSMVCILLP